MVFQNEHILMVRVKQNLSACQKRFLKLPVVRWTMAKYNNNKIREEKKKERERRKKISE